MHIFSKLLLLTLTAATICATAQAEDFSAEEKTQIQTIFNEYIKENPQIIVEALQAYQIREAQLQEEQAEKAVKDNMAAMTEKSMPSVGAENPKVTVIEFFDYNCGYCKRAMPDIQKAIKQNNDVRFVFLDMPIFGERSEIMSKYALAANKQGKYFEYHSALMDKSTINGEEALINLGKEIGLDTEKLKEDAASAEIAKMLVKNKEISSEIGITGTPAFIINGTLYRGYLGPDGMQAEIEKAKKS